MLLLQTLMSAQIQPMTVMSWLPVQTTLVATCASVILDTKAMV